MLLCNEIQTYFIRISIFFTFPGHLPSFWISKLVCTSMYLVNDLQILCKGFSFWHDRTSGGNNKWAQNPGYFQLQSKNLPEDTDAGQASAESVTFSLRWAPDPDCLVFAPRRKIAALLIPCRDCTGCYRNKKKKTKSYKFSKEKSCYYIEKCCLCATLPSLSAGLL